MTSQQPNQSFLWGSGGRRMTPEQIARERQIAASLTSRAGDYSPVGHWTQGAARMVDAIAGGLRERRIDQAERQNASDAERRIRENLASIGAGAPADPVAAALAGSMTPTAGGGAPLDITPSGERADYIRQGLIGRGLPEHIADAFVMNFRDESNLDPGVNEKGPLVPGSRGGYGLYQLTGPRRRAYEAFAQQRGVSPDNVDAQLDFLMQELQGSEARAGQAIMAAPDTPTAAAAIVNDFLRPAERHRAAREARYTGGAVPSVASTLAASGPLPQPNRIHPGIIESIASPYATDHERQIAMLLFQNQMQQNDPHRQAQTDKLRRDMATPNLINAGGGNIYNPQTGAWISAPGAAGAPAGTQAFQTLHQRAQAAGLQEGSPEYQQFMAQGGRSADAPIARIDRLTENLMATGDFVDPQEAAAVAAGIVDGRVRADRHPVTGEVQVVDMATGRVIRGRGAQQSTAAQPKSPPAVAQNTPDQFGQQFPAAQRSFGVEGAIAGAVNTAADAVGAGPVYPDIQQTQASFRVLRESLLNDMASAYNRQPPSWLLKEIRDLTPSPGSPFEGPASAQSKLNAIGRQLTNELASTERSLQRELSPQNRQELEARRAGLQAGIDRIRGAREAFMPQQQKRTPIPPAGRPEVPMSMPGATPGTVQHMPASQAHQPTPYRDGQTATNPQTGQRLVYRNGRWEPVQ